MSNVPPISRRTALKNLAAGAALAGLAAGFARAAGAAPTPLTITPQPFTLPKLDFAYGALEPHFDAKTMEIHYSKHHQAYITNANKALADYPELQKMSAEDLLAKLDTVPEKIRVTLRNNVGGHVNHSLFWTTLSPTATLPDEKLSAALNAAFGSMDQFKTKFTAAAVSRFGSGWAWLVSQGGTLAITSTANQDSPLSAGAVPLLGLDVWEHAYYLKFQNRRADYIAEFWPLVNWTKVSADFAKLG